MKKFIAYSILILSLPLVAISLLLEHTRISSVWWRIKNYVSEAFDDIFPPDKYH